MKARSSGSGGTSPTLLVVGAVVGFVFGFTLGRIPSQDPDNMAADLAPKAMEKNQPAQPCVPQPCVTIVEDPVKQRCEMDYWEAVSKREHGTMSNSHYEKIYTDFFGIDATFYDGKKFLDVGCGPRGSLEWAKTSVERVCVDPLARKYGLLGADAHDMVYVQAGVEEMPFPDNSFDVIASINNLDHVTNADMAMDELARVLRPGGTLLLIVEVHARPTMCEPRTFPWTLTDQLVARGFVVEKEWHTETSPKCKCGPKGGAVYQTCGTNSVVSCDTFDVSDPTPRDGFIGARLTKA